MFSTVRWHSVNSNTHKSQLLITAKLQRDLSKMVVYWDFCMIRKVKQSANHVQQSAMPVQNTEVPDSFHCPLDFPASSSDSDLIPSKSITDTLHWNLKHQLTWRCNGRVLNCKQEVVSGILAVWFSCNNHGQVVHTHVPQTVVMLRGWEDKHICRGTGHVSQT